MNEEQLEKIIDRLDQLELTLELLRAQGDSIEASLQLLQSMLEIITDSRTEE